MKKLNKLLIIILFAGLISCNKEETIRQDTFGFNTDIYIIPINQGHNIKWISADDLTFSVVASKTYILVDWSYNDNIISGFEVISQMSSKFTLIPLSDNQYNVKWCGMDNIFKHTDLFIKE